MDSYDRDTSVLIVDLARNYGGAEARVIEMARSLHDRRRYAVVALAGSPLSRQLADAGLIQAPQSMSRGDPRLLFAIRRLTLRRNSRIVDAHNPQSQFWGMLAAATAGVPGRVCTVHSACRFSERGRIRGPGYEAVLRLSARLGSRFIAVSESVGKYLRNLGIADSRISVIPNAVRSDAWGDGRSTKLTGELGWDKSCFVVVVVARLEAVKGHRYLLEALKLLSSTRPQVRCLLVGDGRARQDIADLAERNGVSRLIHFAGFRQDVGALLRVCDAFCLPSLSEGLPYAALEACTHGLPVVATRVGDIPCVFTDGRDALLVAPGDSAALAEAIGRLMDAPDEAARLGRAACELVRTRFDPGRMIAETLAVYDSGVSGR